MNILLILEGNEEETFFEILQEYGISKKINMRIENVGGSGNIAHYFQSELSNEYNDCIICVYDVDNKANDENSSYNQVRKSLMRILNNDEKVDEVSVCTNPNIILFFLLGVDTIENIILQSTSKKINTDILNKYWPKIGNKKAYKAEKWQLKIIKDSYLYGEYNFNDVLKNAKNIDKDYKNNNPASNLLPLINALIEGNIEFFKIIEIEK